MLEDNYYRTGAHQARHLVASRWTEWRKRQRVRKNLKLEIDVKKNEKKAEKHYDRNAFCEARRVISNPF